MTIKAIAVLTVLVVATDWTFADPSLNVSQDTRQVAQADKPDTPAGQKPASKPKRPPRLSAVREAAALAFVEEHHSELTKLLASLKKNDKKLYINAISQLHRDSQRLAGLFDNDPQRYELELKKWQANSRLQLLAARLRMSKSDELRNDLKTHLKARQEARIAIAKLDRDRAAKRLQQMEKQVKDLESKIDSTVEQQLKDMIKAASGSKGGKPGEKPTSSKTNSTN